MTISKRLELIHEGDYLAEVEVNWEEPEFNVEDPWAPYLTLEDAQKLTDVRRALRAGDVRTAARLARIYTLIPVTAA